MENMNVETNEIPAVQSAETFSERTNPRSDSNTSSNNIELLMDVSMRVTVELGRTRMKLAQILELQHGSVIELDRLAGDPVDVFVNDRMVARGEVVIVDDKFGVRVTEMIPSGSDKAAF